MVDLEKLRYWDAPGETLCAEAADEIERLRDLEQNRYTSLRDEIERLRAELADCRQRYCALLDQLGAGADMIIGPDEQSAPCCAVCGGDHMPGITCR